MLIYQPNDLVKYKACDTNKWCNKHSFNNIMLNKTLKHITSIQKLRKSII